MRNFNEEVVKCKPNMVYIKLEKETLAKIDCWVKKVIEIKKKEGHHIIDDGQEYKRFFTGMMGECAMEKLFGVRFIDWSVGDSSDYNSADLRSLGLNVGIKTVELGKFPVVHKRVYRPELINIRRTEDTIILCGFATVDVLEKYQDDSLILSPKLRQRGTKSGFYGFEHLLKVETLNDINIYL
jgi:hypothetical protein